MRFYRRLSIIFALILVLIILAANLGVGEGFFLLVSRIPHFDTLGHFMLLGTLSLLVNLGFTSNRVRLLRLPLLKSCLILAAIITLEEISQIFLAHRSFDLTDLSANYLGIFLFGEVGAAIKAGKSKE